MACIDVLAGEDAIELYIPCLCSNQFHALLFMRETVKMWALPDTPKAAKRKRAIVITTAHAETVALCIEAQQRYQDQIQKLRKTTVVSPEHRLRNVEVVEAHVVLGCPGREPKASVEKRMKHGQVTLLAHVVRQMQQWHGVDLAFTANVGGNSFGPGKSGLPQQLPGKLLTGVAQRFDTELIPDLTQLAPLLIDVRQGRLLDLRGGDR